MGVGRASSLTRVPRRQRPRPARQNHFAEPQLQNKEVLSRDERPSTFPLCPPLPNIAVSTQPNQRNSDFMAHADALMAFRGNKQRAGQRSAKIDRASLPKRSAIDTTVTARRGMKLRRFRGEVARALPCFLSRKGGGAASNKTNDSYRCNAAAHLILA